MLLALASTGSAAAGLPLLGGSQQGTQSTTFGDQTVGEQRNDADVTQAQGNGNVNVSPALAIFGDAATSNEQGSGNRADASVEQSNTATQSQAAEQSQSLEQSGSGGRKGGSCCGGQSQTGEQSTTFGDQTVGEQRNDADVTQAQGNGNVNVSPALAIFGDAETSNVQGSGNKAEADVDQSNEATQSQDSTQSQRLDQNGGSCCGGQSQTGEQSTTFGDQTVGEQRNDADVDQYQGNGNLNISPAIAIGGKEESCRSKCGASAKRAGDTSTSNVQGSGNRASTDVDQSNSVSQTQSASQAQDLTQSGGGCCQPKGGKPRNGKPNGCKPSRGIPTTDRHPGPCDERKQPGRGFDCCAGEVQVGSQSTSFGDQSVGKQQNDADVEQAQGNKNGNVSPAFGAGRKSGSCKPKCASWKGPGGAVRAHGAQAGSGQGNQNATGADVDQGNTIDQAQGAEQHQGLAQGGVTAS
jgi:hypothetical protein